MRNLTIKRNKSYIAGLSNLQVYIEDIIEGDTVINGVSCRKAGILKNGEEKTFIIDGSETKVFVIVDKLSKSFCNDYYSIPAGVDDVFLSGKNRYNLATGHAFRFDGVTDAEVLKNRKRSTKIGILVLCIAAIIGFAFGFLKNSDLLSDMLSKPKVFSSGGMSITLMDNFTEISEEGYEVCYDSKNVAVFVVKESFSEYEGIDDITLEEYGNYAIELNELDSSVKLQQQDGLTFFEYTAHNDEYDVENCYSVFVYKSDDAFWMVQFATSAENIEKYHESFFTWAKSIEFTNTEDLLDL